MAWIVQPESYPFAGLREQLGEQRVPKLAAELASDDPGVGEKFVTYFVT